jgi:flagella basal body P-ring formation protein FlgA
MFDRGARQSWLRLLGSALAFAVGLSAAMAEVVQLPVPKITIYPGDILSGEMLDMKSIRLLDGSVPIARSEDAAVGKVARRTLLAGKPIPMAYLGDRQVVSQGKSVRLMFSEGGLVISGVGLALQPGGVGDTISIRNVDSGAVIRGVVEPDGSIRIAGP